MGALTLINEPGWQVRLTNGQPAAGASITGGSAVNTAIDANGRLYPTSTGAWDGQDGNTVEIDGVDVTLSVGADTYSVGSDAGITAVVALGSATVAGKTILGISGETFDWGANNWFDGEDYSSAVTIDGADSARPMLFRGTHTNDADDGLATAQLVNVGSFTLGSNISMIHEIDRRFMDFSATSGLLINGGNTDAITIDGEHDGGLLEAGFGSGYTVVYLGTSVPATAQIKVNPTTKIHGGRNLINFAGPTANIDTLEIVGAELYDFSADAIKTRQATNGAKIAFPKIHSPLHSARDTTIGFTAGAGKHIHKSTELVGASDSKQFSLVLTALPTRSVGQTSREEVFYSQGDKVVVGRQSDGKLFCRIKDTSNNDVIDLVSTDIYSWGNSGGVMFCMGISVDTDGTSKMTVWDQHSNAWSEQATQTVAGQTLDLTAGECSIWADENGLQAFTTRFGRCAAWHGTAIDFASTAVQAALIAGRSVTWDLMNTDRTVIETVVGTNPIVDFGTLKYHDWAGTSTPTNQGSDGSNFTLLDQNGAATPVALDIGHGDVWQLFQGGSNLHITGLYGNTVRTDGIDVVSGVQGGLAHDTAGQSTTDAIIGGHVIVTTDTTYGPSVSNFNDAKFSQLLAVGAADLAIGAAFNAHPRIHLRDHGGGSSSNISVFDSVAFAVNDATGTGDAVSTENFVPVDWSGVMNPDYDNEFYGSSFLAADIDTFEKVIAAFALGTGSNADLNTPKTNVFEYYDWTARTADDPRLNSVTADSFTDQTNVTASTVVESNAVEITNIDMYEDWGTGSLVTNTASVNGAVVSLPGSGEFRVLDGAVGVGTVTRDWGTGNHIVSEGDYVQIRVTSDAAETTATDVVVNIGEWSDTWTVITENLIAEPPGSYISFLTFDDPDSVTTLSGRVTAWADQDAGSDVSELSTAGPIWDATRKWAWFDGTKRLDFDVPPSVDLQDFSVFLIAHVIDANTTGLVAGASSGNILFNVSNANPSTLQAFDGGFKTSTVQVANNANVTGVYGKAIYHLTGEAAQSVVSNGVDSSTLAALAAATRDLDYIGAWINGSNRAKMWLQAVVIYDKAQTGSDLTAVEDWAQERFGVPLGSDEHTIIICDGDSLTNGYTGTAGEANQLSYPAQLSGYNLGGARLHNVGTDGWSVSNDTAATRTTGALSTFSGFTNRIVLFWAGTNDIFVGGDSAATVNANIDAWIASVRAADPGAVIGGMTIVDRGGDDADRATVNTHITGSADFDFVVDLAADANLSDASDTTYYQADTIHLTREGYGEVARIVQGQLAADAYI